MQHVGLVHPETDDSPFVVKDEAENKRKSAESVGAGAASRGATSDDGYIECECGETVLLSEFSSHSDLHLAEGMAFEKAEKIDISSNTTILSRDRSPYPDTGTFAPIWPSDASSPSNRDLGPDSTSNFQSRSTAHKHPYTIKDWANVLLGTSPPPRPKITKARRQSARRLGVGLRSILHSHRSNTNYITESRSRSACFRRRDADVATEATRTRRQSHRFQQTKCGWTDCARGANS